MLTSRSILNHPASKPVVHILCLLPFCRMVSGLLLDSLGANPVEAITHISGEWGLRFLLITLTVSPLVAQFKLGQLMRYRRMLGLYSFFYVTLHFLIYYVLDQSLSLTYIIEDIVERPYITAGFTAFLILIPLASTSPIKIRQKMRHNWQRLHYLIYVAGGLAIVHLIWLSKADYLEAGVYGSFFCMLMLYRIWKSKLRSR